jgi:hypothetical protein
MRAAKRPLSPQPPARSPFASLPPVQAAVSAILLAERGREGEEEAAAAQPDAAAAASI